MTKVRPKNNRETILTKSLRLVLNEWVLECDRKIADRAHHFDTSIVPERYVISQILDSNFINLVTALKLYEIVSDKIVFYGIPLDIEHLSSKPHKPDSHCKQNYYKFVEAEFVSLFLEKHYFFENSY